MNKEEYWKRRNNIVEIKDDKGKVVDIIRKPLRGQGEDYSKGRVIAFHTPEEWQEIKRREKDE